MHKLKQVGHLDKELMKTFQKFSKAVSCLNWYGAVARDSGWRFCHFTMTLLDSSSWRMSISSIFLGLLSISIFGWLRLIPLLCKNSMTSNRSCPEAFWRHTTSYWTSASSTPSRMSSSFHSAWHGDSPHPYSSMELLDWLRNSKTC